MISDFFIARPVLANVLAILMIVIGGVAMFALPVAQYPDVVPPTVQVTTRYPGASARTLVDTVALPIEQQVNGVEGMIYMQSYSGADGSYSLTVTFKIGADLDIAQVLVQNRVSSALSSLPQAVQAQGVVVQKNSTAILQIVTLTSPDARYDSLYLANYATIKLKDEIARLPGVGNVVVFGAGQYSMRIWLDPNKMQARGLMPQDVIQALRQQSAQVTAGQIGAPPPPPGQTFQYTLNLARRVSDPAEFAQGVVKTGRAGEITRLSDDGAGHYHRRLRGHGGARIHGQFLDPVRDRAGNRHRGRRRDRGGRRSRPQHREGHVGPRGRERRHAPVARSDHRHHAGADVGVPAGRIPARLDRPHVCAVRAGDRGNRAAERHKRRHPKADAKRDVAAPGGATGAAQWFLPRLQSRLRPDRALVCGLDRCHGLPQPADGGGGGRAHRRHRLPGLPGADRPFSDRRSGLHDRARAIARRRLARAHAENIG